jgi:flagellar biosynthesis protein FliQ
METKAKKSFWGEALKGGTIIGLLLVLIEFITVGFSLRDAGVAWITSLLNIAIIAYGSYHLTKRFSAGFVAEGFSYEKGLGFILSMMLFAGVIVGFGNYILQNFVFPDYYAAVYEQAMSMAGQMMGGGIEMEDMTLDMMNSVTRNPIMQVVSGVLSMLLEGIIIGLVVAIFTRRKPDIFAEAADNNLA